jgi:hypothetical protein
MKPALLTGAALLMAVSSGAFAQGVSAQPAPTGQTITPTGQPPASLTPNPPGTGHLGAINSMDNTRAGSQPDADGLFANVPAQTGLSSKLIGLSVYNSENTDLGTIKDIAFDANGVKAYIVAVGGFLGMGDHYVAVRPSAITISYDAAKDKWLAVMNTNVDQLKSAPEFKYSSAG